MFYFVDLDNFVMKTETPQLNNILFMNVLR